MVYIKELLVSLSLVFIGVIAGVYLTPNNAFAQDPPKCDSSWCEWGEGCHPEDGPENNVCEETSSGCSNNWLCVE